VESFPTRQDWDQPLSAEKALAATLRPDSSKGTVQKTVETMPHIKHATIGALCVSVIGAVMGFLLWAKQLDYQGQNRRIMHLVGWMSLTVVTVAVAVACLSIAFLQYLSAKEREQLAVAPTPQDGAAASRLAQDSI